MISELHHMHWRDLAEHVRATVGQVDALIVDAPYSERTHSGHDVAAASSGFARSINYPHWSPDDVLLFVSTWAPVVRGWSVSITDTDLMPAWRAGYEAAGLYAFAPVPLVETGASVRVSGDGPSSWTTWVCVARPRTRAMATWGTLPGAYIVPAERKPVVGGKPLVAMKAIVRDYTRPGDLVCDPCMGAGTTLLAAKLLGRQYIGGDLDEKHVEIARERIRDLPAQPKGGTLALPWERS